MNSTVSPHTFHIPVMGTGFTIDTPIKIAHLGIHSVMSMVDDVLVEKMRKLHCEKQQLPFEPISDKSHDHRAKRFTAWLNLVAEIAAKNFRELKKDKSAIRRYIDLLPVDAPLCLSYYALMASKPADAAIFQWAEDHLMQGSIDVNIMTKLDRENFGSDGQKLIAEYNDAHAALRGFAQSNIKGTVVFSAGMNPRLYGYVENFPDFFPHKDGNLNKRITLKVSDYRSALIQGKFLAKKGIWVSEYRIESGLNCGGHAFATDGFLMGPILDEFRQKRNDLNTELFEILRQSITAKGLPVPASHPPTKITAQGGVGNAEEHDFLLSHYGVNSVGWGTPFLLVPEVTNVDQATRDKLSAAREEDLELSKISPLGVPYNNLKSNSKDLEKLEYIQKGRPGSPCPKKYIALNTEFTDQGICMASRQYQHLKLKELYSKGLPYEDYNKAHEEVVHKSCICVGLGTAALLVNELDTRVEGAGVSVCPGPNIAYFTGEHSLESMSDHIYGKTNSVARADRPHMFIKELNIYIDYLADKIQESRHAVDAKQLNYFNSFRENLMSGIYYYKNLFSDFAPWNGASYTGLQLQLSDAELRLNAVTSSIAFSQHQA